MITIPTLPLVIATLLTLFLYLKVSYERVIEDVEAAMLSSYLNDSRWLLREFGIVGFVIIRILDGYPEVRWAIQRA